MGGEGSGRPLGIKGIIAREMQKPTPIGDSIYIPDYSGVQQAALKTSAPILPAWNFPIGFVFIWPVSLAISGTTYHMNIPLPDGVVECNGQTISEPKSTYNGCIVPAWNGTDVVSYTDIYYLAGVQSAFYSDSQVWGSLTHTHTIPLGVGLGGGTKNLATTNAASNLPPTKPACYVMRIY